MISTSGNWCGSVDRSGGGSGSQGYWSYRKYCRGYECFFLAEMTREMKSRSIHWMLFAGLHPRDREGVNFEKVEGVISVHHCVQIQEKLVFDITVSIWFMFCYMLQLIVI